MTLNQLRYFCTACRFNSVTHAAKFLHISQSAVSGAIKDLEIEFGTELFIRKYHGFTLTQGGRQLLDLAEGLVDHAEHVSDIMADFGGMHRSIRLGVPPMIGTYMYPKLYQNFIAHYPQSKLVTTEQGTLGLLDALNQETLDLILVPSNNIRDSQYIVQKLTVSETVYCVSRLHPLSEKCSVSIPQIKDEPLIMFRHGFYQNEVIEERFHECQLKPRVIHRTGQFYTLQKFISNNIATGFMLREGSLLSPDVAAIPLDKPISVDISLVWKKGHHLHSDALCFIDFCQEFQKTSK